MMLALCAIALVWYGLNQTIDFYVKRPCTFGIERDSELLTLSVYKHCAECDEDHVVMRRELRFGSPLASKVASRCAWYLMVFTLAPAAYADRWVGPAAHRITMLDVLVLPFALHGLACAVMVGDARLAAGFVVTMAFFFSRWVRLGGRSA